MKNPTKIAIGMVATLALAGGSLAQTTTTVSTGPFLPGRSSGLGGVRASFPQTHSLSRPAIPGMSSAPRTSAIPSVSVPAVVGGGRTVIVSPTTGRTFIDGSTLTVNGSLDTDNFDLAFHVGTPAGVIVSRPPIVVVGGWTGFPTCWGYWSEYTYEHTRGFDGVWTPVDPAVVGYETPQPAEEQPQVEYREPTPLELAQAYLEVDRADDAIEHFRKHLSENADDHEAMRLLGIALIQTGDPRTGVAMVSLAYSKDPSLASNPLQSWQVGGDEPMRAALRRAVTFAHAEKTASAWLTVAILMQGEGRLDTARPMLDNAVEQGLEEPVSEALEAALAG